MKLSDLNAEGQAHIGQLFASHTETLRRNFIDATAQAQRYLATTNGGAIVALLAFMGASPGLRHTKYAWVCLGCFSFGIFALGILLAINYHQGLSLLTGWIQKTDIVLQSDVDISSPFEWVNKRAKSGWGILFGYLSWGAFLMGLIVALLTLPRGAAGS